MPKPPSCDSIIPIIHRENAGHAFKISEGKMSNGNKVINIDEWKKSPPDSILLNRCQDWRHRRSGKYTVGISR